MGQATSKRGDIVFLPISLLPPPPFFAHLLVVGRVVQRHADAVKRLSGPAFNAPIDGAQIVQHPQIWCARWESEDSAAPAGPHGCPPLAGLDVPSTSSVVSSAFATRWPSSVAFMRTDVRWLATWVSPSCKGSDTAGMSICRAAGGESRAASFLWSHGGSLCSLPAQQWG